MRINRDFEVFACHYDWFTTVKGIGYVPTEKAPPEAVEAMKRYNKRAKEDYEKELAAEKELEDDED